MERKQIEAMLFIEKSYSKLSIQSHPKRRLIADSLHKVCILYNISNKNFVFMSIS